MLVPCLANAHLATSRGSTSRASGWMRALSMVGRASRAGAVMLLAGLPGYLWPVFGLCPYASKAVGPWPCIPPRLPA
jgi:hypothetical protein